MNICMLYIHANSGVTCGYIFVPEESEEHLTPAFEALKLKNSEFTGTKLLMTDCAPAFNNAWTKVNGNKHKWIVCDWHVKRSWKQQFRAKSVDKQQVY